MSRVHHRRGRLYLNFVELTVYGGGAAVATGTAVVAAAGATSVSWQTAQWVVHTGYHQVEKRVTTKKPAAAVVVPLEEKDA